MRKRTCGAFPSHRFWISRISKVFSGWIWFLPRSYLTLEAAKSSAYSGINVELSESYTKISKMMGMNLDKEAKDVKKVASCKIVQLTNSFV
ncbi:hypothetical protein ES708_26630 [subsurface metagenome]